MVGIGFFTTGDSTFIRVVNLKGIEYSLDIFSTLVGLSLLARPKAQFWYKRFDDGTKLPEGEAIDGKYYYTFTVQQAVEVLEEAHKDPAEWRKLSPETEVFLIASACEVK